ncbi:MAG: hypothetical protein WCH05_10690 [Chlorobiaceae bacterium]
MVTQFVSKIREINQRYSKPTVEMSPAVKFSLTVLRVYLFLLVILMVYKFITVIKVI